MSANRARRRARQAAAIEAIKADGNRLPAAQKAGGVTFSPEQAVALARASQVSTVANPLPQALLDAIPFGPGQPLRISPINAPRTDSGRPEPRQYEYPQSWNLPGFSDRLVPWAVLRSAADQIPLIRQCIEIRKNEVATLKWDIRISKDAIQQEMQRSGGSRQDVHTEMMKRLAPDIQRAKAFWEEPDKRNGHDFAAWANKFLEEHFVLDAVAVYPRLTRGGDPYSLEILDGSTIKPLLDEYGHRPLPPQPAYQQVLQGFPRGEFVADAVEDIGPDGEPQTTIPGAYPSDRLFYLVHNTRTTSPYGYSAVEQALIDGDLWLRRHGWIKAEYTDGVMPSGWLEAGPGQADWTPDQLTIYGDALNEYLAGDTKARQRFRILPYGMKPSDQTQAPERYKPDFDMFLLKLVARHLDTTIAELGFTEQGGLGSTGWHEGQADVQERAGTGPTIRRIESWCTRIGRRFLSLPAELEFAIVGDDEDEDATENKTWVEKTQAGGATLNEWRDEMGLPRYEFDEANKPFLVGAGGPIFLEGAIAKQEAQQAAADALTTAQAAGALPVAPDGAGAAPGPADGSQADGGQAKAPGDTTTKLDSPETAKADEIRGYRRWRRRNTDRARPFEFAHHTLSDLAELGIDPAVDPVTIKADDPDLVKAGDIPKAPAPTPGPATWPGWEVDLALAQLYAETLSQGLTGVVPDGFVDSFIAAVEAGTARSAILDWIERHGPAADVVDTVRSALADLYTEGYLVGDRSAVSVLTGAPADWADWSAGRPGAARKLISADGRQVGLQDLLDQAEVGIKSISANRLDELAGVLADGLDANQSPDEIARAVDGLFGDRQWAEMVTHTELSRAQTAASLDRYDEAGVGSTEWATAPDERVCEICKGNKDAGPVKLGERYPSGEYAPPGHPWCRCVILPTIDEGLFKVDYLVNLDIPEWVWAWDSSLHPRGPDGRFLPTMSGMRRLKERHVRAKAAGRDLTKLNEEIGRRLQYWQGMATPVEVKPKREHPLAEYAFGRSSAGGSAHAPLNAALRGQTEHTDETRALQARLDQQFEQAPPLTRGRKVYRVVSGDSRLRGQMISTAKDKGIWTEPGFMSSSKSRDVLGDFDVGGNRVELEITVPAGAKALDVDPHLDPNNPDHYGQGEALLPRGTRLQFGLPTPQPGGGTLIKAKVVVDRPGEGSRPPTPPKPPKPPEVPKPTTPGVPERVSARDAKKLARTVKGTDERSEYTRRALQIHDSFPGATTYATRDADGRVTGAVGLYRRDAEHVSDMGVSIPAHYIIDYMGAEQGNGRALAEAAIAHAARNGAGIMAEPTTGSNGFWRDKIGLVEDPLGIGSPHLGLDHEGAKQYRRPEPKPSGPRPAGPEIPAGVPAEHRRVAERLGTFHDPESGLTAELQPIRHDPKVGQTGTTHIDYVVRDAEGRQVGVANRRITTDRAGKTMVDHGLFELDPSVQRRGFATRFNARNEQAYWDTGVDRIVLTADGRKRTGHVGGQVWAKQGYQFANPTEAKTLVNRALRAKALDDAERVKLERLRDRLAAGDAPAPLEIMQTGPVGEKTMQRASYLAVKRRPEPKAPEKPKPKAKDLLKAAGEQVMTGSLGAENPAEKEFMDLVRGSMEMTDPDSGLHAKVEQGSVSGSGKAHIEFQIYDRDGVRQGSATRSWHTDGSGNLVVEHEWLKLRKDVQGSGFAAKWNAHNEAFYREHGVDRIELHANLDVGGYAWAKQGYNWSEFTAMLNLRLRLDRWIDQPDRYTPGERAALDALRQRMTQAHFDAGTAPTPLAFAMVGYQQGKNRVDENGRETWAGKQLMLGANWGGAKKL